MNYGVPAINFGTPAANGQFGSAGAIYNRPGVNTQFTAPYSNGQYGIGTYPLNQYGGSGQYGFEQPGNAQGANAQVGNGQGGNGQGGNGQPETRFGNAPLGTPLGNLEYAIEGYPYHFPSAYGTAAAVAGGVGVIQNPGFYGAVGPTYGGRVDYNSLQSFQQNGILTGLYGGGMDITGVPPINYGTPAAQNAAGGNKQAGTPGTNSQAGANVGGTPGANAQLTAPYNMGQYGIGSYPANQYGSGQSTQSGPGLGNAQLGTPLGGLPSAAGGNPLTYSGEYGVRAQGGTDAYGTFGGTYGGPFGYTYNNAENATQSGSNDAFGGTYGGTYGGQYGYIYGQNAMMPSP
jgi:hypothetical protein